MKQKLICLIVFSAALSAFAAEYYVDASRPDDSGAATNWPTAKQTIQAAVDLTADGDTVWVTNGIYDVGGAITPGYASMNRVVITNDITVRSVNGSDTTLIVGEGPIGDSAVRGAYMSAGTLSGFTITNGHTHTSGDFYYDRSGAGVNLYGGAGVVSNCILSGNSAYMGGGSYYGTLNNCTLTNNSSNTEGAGSCYSTLNHCTLIDNSADDNGGGSYESILNNCLLTRNSSVYGIGGGSYKPLCDFEKFGMDGRRVLRKRAQSLHSH